MEHGRFIPRRTTRSSSRQWVRRTAAGVDKQAILMWFKCSNVLLHVICSSDLPADVIKMAKDIKPITEIKQSGNDFVVTSKTPGKTVTNSFTIGKEADITTMDGKKIKVCNSARPTSFEGTVPSLLAYSATYPSTFFGCELQLLAVEMSAFSPI